MRTREIALLIAVPVLLGAAAFLLLGPGAHPVEASPTGLAPTAEAPAAAEAGHLEAPAPAEPAPTALRADPRSAAPAAELTAGVIRGNIWLSPAVLQQVDALYVRVQEAIQNNGDPPRLPYVLTRKEPINPHGRTPEFTYEGIPFSEYGYNVSVFADGVNGAQQFVPLDRDHPIADVALTVTEGVAFNVLLRDQTRAPVAGTKVFMVPYGEPLGRPLLQKESDSYGAASFESVLQGVYEIRVGTVNQPENEPSRVEVQAHAGVRSATIEVPRGFDLDVYTQVRGTGWAAPGVKLHLLALDQKRLREWDLDSDGGGRATFHNLLPGSYQLDARSDKHEVRTVKVTVPDNAPPPPVSLDLVPRRR